jgi:pimeloyl-ACP methyl ester carboxylesterase
MHLHWGLRKNFPLISLLGHSAVQGPMTSLVLVPALGCGAGLYAELIPLLPRPDHCRVTPVSAGTMDECAGKVLAEAPPSFVVMGTSFGGVVAAHVAVKAPERVKGLIIAGSWPGKAADPAAGVRRANRLRGNEFEAAVAEMAVMIAWPEGPRGPRTQAAFTAMARNQGGEFMARQSEAMAHREDLLPGLSQLACPALLLWGEFDRFVPSADGRKLAAMIPRSRYVELPACGHFPSLEYPEESAAIIEHWLADHRLF